MKLPILVPNGTHSLEGAPPGVEFDGRTVAVGDDVPRGARYPCLLVGHGDGVEVTLQITIAAADKAPAPKPRRRRKPTPTASTE